MTRRSGPAPGTCRGPARSGRRSGPAWARPRHRSSVRPATDGQVAPVEAGSREPVWQAAPTWSTRTSSASPSQSSATPAHVLDVAARVALAPVLLAAAAPERDPSGGQRAVQRLVVHPADHQHLAGVVLLDDGADQAVAGRASARADTSGAEGDCDGTGAGTAPLCPCRSRRTPRTGPGSSTAAAPSAASTPRSWTPSDAPDLVRANASTWLQRAAARGRRAAPGRRHVVAAGVRRPRARRPPGVRPPLRPDAGRGRPAVRELGPGPGGRAGRVRRPRPAAGRPRPGHRAPRPSPARWTPWRAPSGSGRDAGPTARSSPWRR